MTSPRNLRRWRALAAAALLSLVPSTALAEPPLMKEQSVEPKIEATSPDGRFAISLGGFLQARSTAAAIEEEPDTSQFGAPRTRFYSFGYVHSKDFRYRLMVGTPPYSQQLQLFDAYIETRLSDALRLRAGRFKLPVFREWSDPSRPHDRAAKLRAPGTATRQAMPPTSNKNQRAYEHRVNRVIDHIQTHRTEALSLETLAQIAAFSPFHFHRIFRAITGENLGEFIQRVRLEWAGSALLVRLDDEVLAIALDSGFQSASAFARAFKDHFGMTATEWRNGGAAAWSKNRKAHSNPGQAEGKEREAEADACGHSRSGEGQSALETRENTVNVTVKNLPSYRLAYLRHVGPYGAGGGVPQLWERLRRWAIPRDLWTPERLCIGMAPDNPYITPPEKCRYDAAIVIPADFQVDEQVNRSEFPAGKYAIMPFEGTALDIAAGWDRLFRAWMPQSGYQPDDGPACELYEGEAFNEVTGVVKSSLCVPVKPL